MRAPWLLAASATCSAPDRVHRVEALASPFHQHADEIDQHMRVARGRLDRGAVTDIGLHRVNLADPAERLQVIGKLRPAHRDPDTIVAPGQRAHDVAADKTRAAIDGDEGFRIASGGHFNARGG